MLTSCTFLIFFRLYILVLWHTHGNDDLAQMITYSYACSFRQYIQLGSVWEWKFDEIYSNYLRSVWSDIIMLNLWIYGNCVTEVKTNSHNKLCWMSDFVPLSVLYIPPLWYNGITFLWCIVVLQMENTRRRLPATFQPMIELQC